MTSRDKTAHAIKKEAALWVARVDGGLTPEEEAELNTWLAADTRHAGAYARALGYWVHIDRLAALLAPAKQPVRQRSSVRPVGRRELIAAGVATVAGVSWWLLRPNRQHPVTAPALSYGTSVGEIKRVALNDGSVLVLNTASSVEVLFDKHQRDVRLLDGEVVFQVAHDRARPFIVEVRNAVARAVGTAFVVRIDSDRVDLTVTEGVVDVGHSRVDLINGQGASVSANQQAIFYGASELQIHSIDPAEVKRELAWRDGMVAFDGQSLQVAVSEINRYNQKKIIVDDLALAAKPVVGVFGIMDVDGFAAAAAAAFKATVIEDGDVIRLASDSKNLKSGRQRSVTGRRR
jgi:transmembrane sensor